MKKALLIGFIVLLVILVVLFLPKKNTQNVWLEYTKTHQPYEKLSDAPYEIYLTSDQVIITYQKESKEIWTAQLKEFVSAVLPTVCGGECTDENMARSSVKLYSIGIDAQRKVILDWEIHTSTLDTIMVS
jgi:hypothetical protein